jgi:hypothetical protein
MVALTTGALLAVVTVMSSPYVKWLSSSGAPGTMSRHGRLAAPGDYGGGLHAIVLVGRYASGFTALDPYFPAHDPMLVDDDAFASFFAGHAYVADP